MPSPVELIQLNTQYQRNVGTPSASNSIRREGADTPAPGSTSSASTFLSATHAKSRAVPTSLLLAKTAEKRPDDARFVRGVGAPIGGELSREIPLRLLV